MGLFAGEVTSADGIVDKSSHTTRSEVFELHFFDIDTCHSDLLVTLHYQAIIRLVEEIGRPVYVVHFRTRSMVRHRIAVHLSGVRHKNHQTVILRGKLRKQIEKIGKILRFRLPRRGGMLETVDRVEDEDAASPTQDKLTGFGKHPFRSGAAFEGDMTDVFGRSPSVMPQPF